MGLDVEQHRAELDGRGVLEAHLADGAHLLGGDLVHELHGLDDAQRLVGGNLVPHLHERRFAGCRGDEYETPVKYWMPFNGGVGFHDASWQPTFGGSRYLTNGSHGCVNMPPEMAGKLFDLISAGTPVVVHN